jgi:hypothetical protein
MRYLLLLSLAISACGNNSAPEKPTDDIPAPVNQSTGLADSIAKKYRLTTDQIRPFGIDSIYYTQYKNATFTGDSIWNLKNGAKAATLIYSDGLSCLDTFIVTFSAAGYPAAGMLVSADCDTDGEREFTKVGFGFTSDSSFFVHDSWMSPSFKPISSDTTKWIITSGGSLHRHQ